MTKLSLSAITAVLSVAIAQTQAATTSASASASSSASSSTSAGVPAQVSPAYLSGVVPMTGNVNSYPGLNATIPTGNLPTVNFNLTGYPTAWVTPPTTGAEITAVIAAIDWTKVPAGDVHKADANGDLTFTGYDANTDPDCWWSASGCVKSKNPLIPPDVYQCPEAGTWGLTYDDGPLTPDAGNWSEPNLYNFLAEHNQKAGLFYIGSNVVAAPAAAQRALADGHTICVHTWSHPPMTTMTNDGVVAELYWTLKAIKETTGITPKCWRPPYGDVDDRVRGIAWQMGLTTVIWDEDTNDWNMPGSGGGTLPPATVDGYFEGWIDAYKNGTDNVTGHIVLEHELNNATVAMAEKWLPTLQQTFKVVPWNQCMNITQPYWESNFVYPAFDGSIPANTTKVTATAAVSSALPTVSSGAIHAASASASASKSASTSAGSQINIVGSSVFAVIFAMAVAVKSSL